MRHVRTAIFALLLGAMGAPMLLSLLPPAEAQAHLAEPGVASRR
ncbi:hypothetical protein BCF33_0943 [Hasllibacter halocynthiae]|uniref:Uncharacterized protein n=1 Tax=Hasllibacter halocynthiae TaxID=595589 RepID=A0A2T0X8T8_9RHOB|nr:hypothetical protein [Hasllibacter halocynthiae]PRY95325.1 hypothetical protein BCF33_0943 [Hasllibacter halocynthiae]